jgi:hypothetical protein
MPKALETGGERLAIDSLSLWFLHCDLYPNLSKFAILVQTSPIRTNRMKIPTLLRKLPSALIIVITMFIALGQSSPVRAQDSITFDNVLVEIWPEYDKPSALVMYQFTLASTVKLPAEVIIRIPEKAGMPHAVATEDEAGLLNLSYETSIENGWELIKFTTAVTKVRLEFYDPGLSIQGTQRKYTYTWPGDYAVNSFTMQVQQPFNAADMSLIPDMGSGQKGQDGLVYYNMLVGQVKAGTTFDLQIAYTKPDNTLTNANSFEQAQPAQQVDNNTPGRVATLNDFLPWVLGGLGILLIAVGGFWYWRTGQAATAPSRARHSTRRAASADKMSPTTNENEAIYCSQCGKRAGPGDLFCRTCGTKLRG